MNNLSGTITLGGTAQTIAAFNPARDYFTLQNTSDTDMWVMFGSAATAASPSFLVEAGADIEFGADAKELICRSISVIGATTGKTFTAFDSGA